MYPLFLCTNPYIYISTSYTYMCVHMYIYISISISIYIYNVYIYIQTFQNMPNPKHHPALPKSKGRHRPRVIDGWMVLQQTRVRRRCLLDQRSMTETARSPGHPITRSPSIHLWVPKTQKNGIQLSLL
jgi:hypothetical protein